MIISDLTTVTALPHSDDLLTALDAAEVRGLAVWPIRIKSRSERRPVAILKVDFPEIDLLVDNQPTRDLLDNIASKLALAFQHALALSGKSVEEFLPTEEDKDGNGV